jgi:hypothetical protein
MIVMAYFMSTMSKCATNGSNETHVDVSTTHMPHMGQADVLDSGHGMDMTTADSSMSPGMDHDDCHSMIMITAGLSLENLIMLLLCTPCQVSEVWREGFWFYYATAFARLLLVCIEMSQLVH